VATYYVIARMDGTRFVGPDHHKVDLYDALQRGVTTFIPSAWQDHDPLAVDDDEASPKTDVPVGLLVYPDPAQAGLGIADDMTLSLGIDGGYRMFQLQAVPAPEHYTPSSTLGAQAIVTREFLVVATKTDRLSGNVRTKNLATIKREFELDEVLAVSAKTNGGIGELWNRVGAVEI